MSTITGITASVYGQLSSRQAGGARIISAITEDLDGDLCNTCITFTMSQCLYALDSGVHQPTWAVGSYFLVEMRNLNVGTFNDWYRLPESVGAIHTPTANPPFVKTYNVNYTSPAVISTARAGGTGEAGEQNWMEDDELRISYLSDTQYTLNVLPSCDNADIDPATDSPLDAFSNYPVINLYQAPYLTGASVG